MKRNAGWMLLAALCVLLCACRAQRSAVPAAAAGRYSGESVCIYGGERTPMDEVYSGESYLELREDGRGTLCLGGDEAGFRWQLDGTALTLTSGRETCRGTLENGRIETDLFGADIRLSFRQSAAPAQEPAQSEEPGPAAEESPEPDAISWPGDWYGWYAIVDAGSDYDEFKDSAWAACARITRTEDAGSIEVWDTETAAGERIGKMKIRFAKGEGPSGSLALKSGKFWDETLQKDGWSCDPARTDVRNFPQMICLSALAGDPASDSWFRIRLYLRPWGVDWSDVRTGDVSGCWYEDMMPPGYDSWYARLLAQGTAQMPDSFGEGWALLREGGD